MQLFGTRSRAIRYRWICRRGIPSVSRSIANGSTRALWARGVAVVSARRLPVDSVGSHDRLEKTEKMHKFNRFGVFCPPNQACGRPSGTIRVIPAKDRLGAKTGNEVERDARFGAPTRAVMGGFLMQHPRTPPAIALSADRRSLANSASVSRFGSTGRDRSAVFPRSGMSVASLFVIRVAVPSAQPVNEEAV